jgi:hypothetical protein
MMHAPRIRDVEPLPGHRLLVAFVNGDHRVYDCTPLLGLDSFRLLDEEAFFRSVTVDPGGYGVSWNDDADLSEYELWTEGEDVSPLTPRNRAILQEAEMTPALAKRG